MIPLVIIAFLGAEYSSHQRDLRDRVESATRHEKELAKIREVRVLFEGLQDHLTTHDQSLRKIQGRMDHQSGRIDNNRAILDKRVAVLETLLNQKNLNDKINELYNKLSPPEKNSDQ